MRGGKLEASSNTNFSELNSSCRSGTENAKQSAMNRAPTCWAIDRETRPLRIQRPRTLGRRSYSETTCSDQGKRIGDALDLRDAYTWCAVSDFVIPRINAGIT